MSWDPYFTASYYRKERPVWDSYAPDLFAATRNDSWLIARLLGLGLALGVIVALLFRSRRRF